MSEGAASLLVVALEVYLALGLLFAIPFVVRGAGRIDPAARDGTWGFRLLILPASAVLWPWLLLRWRRGGPPPEERSPHRGLAGREAGG